MKENGLRARPRHPGLPKDDGALSVIADYLLAREFQADRPNGGRRAWQGQPGGRESDRAVPDPLSGWISALWMAGAMATFAVKGALTNLAEMGRPAGLTVVLSGRTGSRRSLY